MPYFVETAPLPPVTLLPNGTVSPQLKNFTAQLANRLNLMQQNNGLHLEQVIQLQNVAILVYKN